MNLAKKINQLKRLSLDEMAASMAIKLKRAFFERSERLDLEEPLRARPLPANLSLHNIGLIHIDVLTPGFAQAFLDAYPQEAAQLIDKSNRICDLELNILGSGPVNLGEFKNRPHLQSIDPTDPSKLQPARINGLLPWHFDIKADKGWDPKTFFADIRYGHAHGMDIKVPWEFSRCAHFITLGQAYRLTYDEKYARNFIFQIEDWWQENPSKYGVNWSSPMEVGLRACNWIVAWELFKGAGSLPGNFPDRLAFSLYEHGEHIVRHIEFGGGVPTNHYVANLLSIYYIGLALRQETWTRQAGKGLLKEIERQTYDDGFDYEGSTAYHCLVLEMFTCFYALATRLSKGRDLERFSGRLRKMFEALQSFLMPNGSIPFIGDNDSAGSDRRYLAEAGKRLFGPIQSPERKWPSSSDSVWIFGFDRAQEKPPPSQGGRKAQTRISPKSSGLIILRGPDDYLSFSAQPNGARGIGHHTHNDKLSFTLFCGGEDFIIDPGTYVYTSFASLRNKFRSTSYHNTVEIDGEEQNRFPAEDLFRLEDDARVKILEYKEASLVRARHDGYRRLEDSVLHEREIKRIGDPLGWRIHDRLIGRRVHQLKWTFVLAPQVKPVIETPSRVLLQGEAGQITLAVSDPSLTFKIEEGEYAPAYGVLKPTAFLRIEREIQLPFDVRFNLKWDPLGWGPSR